MKQNKASSVLCQHLWTKTKVCWNKSVTKCWQHQHDVLDVGQRKERSAKWSFRFVNPITAGLAFEGYLLGISFKNCFSLIELYLCVSCKWNSASHSRMLWTQRITTVLMNLSLILQCSSSSFSLSISFSSPSGPGLRCNISPNKTDLWWHCQCFYLPRAKRLIFSCGGRCDITCLADSMRSVQSKTVWHCCRVNQLRNVSV